MQPFSITLLNEAVRFGNVELRELMRHINKFRFGLEFEFNVNDEYATDVLNTLTGPLADTIKDEYRAKLIPIVSQVEELIQEFRNNSSQFREYKELLLDELLGKLSEDERDYLINDVVGMDILEGALHSAIELETLYEEMESIVNRTSRDLKRLDIGMDEVMRVLAIPTHNRLSTPIGIILRERDSLYDEPVNLFKAVDNLLEKILNLPMVPADEVTEEFDIMFGGATKMVASKVDFIQSIIGHYMNTTLIEKVSADITVPRGVEVITVPLVFDDIPEVMNGISDLIDEYGYTDNSTGLHVNISYPGFEKKLNPAKMAVLMDADFFQNLSPQIRRKVNRNKFMVRSDMVEPVSAFLRKSAGEGRHVVDLLAIEYIRGGDKVLVESFEKFLAGSNEKFRSINFENIFDANVSQRRVEFRFFGGNDYENRNEETINDITYISYVMLVSEDGFMQREYLSGIIKMLDRASIEVRGMDFSSLVNDIRYKNDLGLR